MEKHTMIIEYIGEVIRTEVSEIREKQYEAKVWIEIFDISHFLVYLKDEKFGCQL